MPKKLMAPKPMKSKAQTAMITKPGELAGPSIDHVDKHVGTVPAAKTPASASLKTGIAKSGGGCPHCGRPY